ncbi:MAG TPA: MFS transporter [Acidobacteriota bacterium]
MSERPGSLRSLPRNVWVASAASFFTDVSSEMLQNVLPLFLANVLGVRTVTIGLIEGVAQSTASLVSLYAGALTDRLQARKWLAVAGYAVSSCSKPFFYVATSWPLVAGVRWADRVGKGIRTAPRDALIAESIVPGQRGLAFGLHRGADTAGAVFGLLATLAVVYLAQRGALELERETFQQLVLVSLVPAFLAVLILAAGAKEVRALSSGPPVEPPSGSALHSLGTPFKRFLLVAALFDLGNSSDAFLVLRAQERGMSVIDVLWTLLAFNVVYALLSAPAGRLSDRIGRRHLIVAGWTIYALIYLGFAVASTPAHVVGLYLAYGAYYGLVMGTAKAFVADLVGPENRGVAYGAYYGVMAFLDLPASLIAGALWQGVGGWAGFGPAAPFVFGAAMAAAATVLLVALVPTPKRSRR